MLKQDGDLQGQPASEVRVRKEELARAVAALEARRQTEAERAAGTVVIGDVLQQLQIDVPAEEVLHEIQSLHAGQTRGKPVRRKFWDADRIAGGRLAFGIIAVPLAAVIIGSFILRPVSPPKPTVTGGGGWRNMQMMMPPPLMPTGVTDEMMAEDGFNASSVLKPLSEVSEDQPVHCNTRSLMRLVGSAGGSYNQCDPAALARSEELFDVRPDLHRPWALIKHNGRLYLRAWVAAKFTEAQARGRSVALHASEQSFDPGVNPNRITVALTFRPYMSYAASFGRQGNDFKAMDVTLDSHAWEKW